MKAIIKRELFSYFVTMSGWVFIGFFVLMSAVYFTLINVFSQIPDYSITLNNETILFLILIPALTMRFFAGEARQNTDRLLFTSPVNVNQIVLGKFFGALLLFLSALAITAIFPIILSFFGTLPAAKIIGTFVGFAFVGCSFIAVGLFVSSLSNSQIISAIGTLCALLLLFLIDVIIQVLPSSGIASVIFVAIIVLAVSIFFYKITKSFYISITLGSLSAFLAALVYFLKNDLYTGLIAKILNWLSIMSRFDNFAKGILNLSDIVYYITFSAAFIFLTVTVTEARRNKSR